jgi:hypothetical protein
MRLPRQPAAILLIGAVLAAITTAAAVASPRSTVIRARVPVPANVNISREPGNQTEDAVAIQQTDPRNVVVVSNLEVGSALFHAWSTDGGRTWQTNHIFSGACCDPSMASDEHGNIFLTWLDGGGPVLVAVSTNGGATFRQIASFWAPGALRGPASPSRSDPRMGPLLAPGDQPSIAAGENSVWVTFTKLNGDIVAQGARVTGLGQVSPFGPQEVPNGGHTGGGFGDVAIGPGGQVVISWQDPTGGEGPATVYGAIDGDGLGPQPMGPASPILVSNVGGFDFIPAQSGRSVDIEVKLEYDRTGGPRDGRLYLLWTSETPQESDNMDIQVQFSDNDGATWSQPVRVNNDAGTKSQFNPRMSLDPTTGDLAVAWYDARHDFGDFGPGDTNGQPNDDATVYSSVSRNGGVTFSPNFRLSKGVSNAEAAQNGIDYGDYEGMAFYGGNYFYVWADNSNSTGDNPDGKLHEFDLYTARVHVP